ncbi:MAG: response regulator [Verrucomicrobia bacterium]|nr:response regulator [Verrucomicrobiota bacterium]
MQKTKNRILIADPDEQLARLLKKHKSASRYVFETAKNGFECLSKIETFQPDLVLMELMLPQIHGMEILRKVKCDPRTKHIGVIITSAHVMIQNYQAAIKLQCDYFLEKPFEPSEIFTLFKLFFNSDLHPDPFSGKESAMEGKHCYVPKMHTPNSYIKFWGTRGSNPVSGPDYVRFGGNTSCLEIRHGHDLIIVDAGTGIRPLGSALCDAKPKNIHLLISHTHWDHLAGFPFFAPIYDPNCHITIWTPIGFEKTTRELFTEMLAYAYFPVRLDDIQANLSFKDMLEGDPFQIGHINVNTHYAYHPGATLCFKFGINKTTFGYATDNEFLMGYHGNPSMITKKHPLITPYRSMIKFFKDCDFLIHEAQYTPIEYQKKVGWGHSSITNATALILQAEIREWIITHHDPKHTDGEILKKMQMQYDVFDEINYGCRPRMAFDGMTIPI